VRCFPNEAAGNALPAGLPAFPVGTRQVATWEKTYAQFDTLCAQQNASLAPHDTSTDVSRDMNLLRQAMGLGELNYLGLSYGTGLGAIYANLFPATVGHMALDGNVDPVAWSQGGSLPDSLREGEDLAQVATMHSLLTLCGAASTAACAFSAGTPAATQAKFDTLLDRLRQHPVTISSPPQTFTYADTICRARVGALAPPVLLDGPPPCSPAFASPPGPAGRRVRLPAKVLTDSSCVLGQVGGGADGAVECERSRGRVGA